MPFHVFASVAVTCDTVFFVEQQKDAKTVNKINENSVNSIFFYF